MLVGKINKMGSGYKGYFKIGALDHFIAITTEPPLKYVPERIATATGSW